MLLRVCDRCGKKEQARTVEGTAIFKKYGADEKVLLSLEILFDKVDICAECVDWFIKEAKWK